MSSWQSKLRPWLARFAFSFIIIAIVLLWEGYKALGGNGRPQQAGRAIACFVGAGAFMALGAAGNRERHRHDQ